MYAREVMTNAALKGQAQLVHQLKKSYSMSDISRDEEFPTQSDALEVPDGFSRRRRKSTTSNRLKIEEILEESDHSDDDDEEIEEERVVRGYYADGREVVEEEFRYLEEELEDNPSSGLRRSKRTRKPVANPEDGSYATLPRAAGRRKKPRSGIPQDW